MRRLRSTAGIHSLFRQIGLDAKYASLICRQRQYAIGSTLYTLCPKLGQANARCGCHPAWAGWSFAMSQSFRMAVPMPGDELLGRKRPMCFRPAEVNAGAACPNCGKKINVTQGLLPKKCPFCKTSLEGIDPASLSAPDAGAPAAPSAPSAPGAPAAPSAPKPPTQ